MSKYYKIFSILYPISTATLILKSLDKKDFYLNNVPLRLRDEYERIYENCEKVNILSIMENHQDDLLNLKIIDTLKKFNYLIKIDNPNSSNGTV